MEKVRNGGYGYDDDIGRHILTGFEIRFGTNRRNLALAPEMLHSAAAGDDPYNMIGVRISAVYDLFCGETIVDVPFKAIQLFHAELKGWSDRSLIVFPSPRVVTEVDHELDIRLLSTGGAVIASVCIGSEWEPLKCGRVLQGEAGGICSSGARITCVIECDQECIADAVRVCEELLLWMTRVGK